MDLDNPELPANDPKYAVSNKKNGVVFDFKENIRFELKQRLDKALMPRSECLKDTVERFLPFWHDTVVPQLKVRQLI